MGCVLTCLRGTSLLLSRDSLMILDVYQWMSMGLLCGTMECSQSLFGQRGYIYAVHSSSIRTSDMCSFMCVLLLYRYLITAAFRLPNSRPTPNTTINATIEYPALRLYALLVRSSPVVRVLSLVMMMMLEIHMPRRLHTTLYMTLEQLRRRNLNVCSDQESDLVRRYLWVMRVIMVEVRVMTMAGAGLMEISVYEAMMIPPYITWKSTFMKQSMNSCIFTFSSFIRKRKLRRMVTERPRNVLTVAELVRVVRVARVVALLLYARMVLQVVTAPAALKLGHVMNATTTPMTTRLYERYDYCILSLAASMLPRKAMNHSMRLHVPEYRNIRSPPPPSYMPKPLTKMAQSRQYPMVMRQVVVKWQCQQSKRGRKSREVSREGSVEKRHLRSKAPEMGKEVDANPVKQQDQKGMNRREICRERDRVSKRFIRGVKKNLRQGVYTTVIAKQKERIEGMYERQVEVRESALPNAPMKITATTSNTITTIVNIQ